MSHNKKVEQRRKADREREERHKRDKKIASLSGQAGAMMDKAAKLNASARLPYSAEKGWFGVKGTCSVCDQPLERTTLGLALIPHTPTTCPGPAAKVTAK